MSQSPPTYSESVPLPASGAVKWFPLFRIVRPVLSVMLFLLVLEQLFGHPAVVHYQGGHITIIGERWEPYETDRKGFISIYEPQASYGEWFWRLISRKP